MIVITGANGQDGRILTHLLSRLGRDVLAVVSSKVDKQTVFSNLKNVTVLRAASPLVMGLSEFSIKSPEVLIHFAGASSVADSIRNPIDSLKRNINPSLEAMEFCIQRSIPLLFPSSSEVFDRKNGQVDESSTHKPGSPYGLSKSKISEIISALRAKGLLRATVATLFNHESPLRPPGFLTKSIATQAIAAISGETDSIVVKSLDSAKDFSWAPELVALFAHPPFWEANLDFVLGSGELVSVSELAQIAARQTGLELRVEQTGETRENDVHPVANSFQAFEKFGWKTTLSRGKFMEAFVELELASQKYSGPSKLEFIADQLSAEALKKLRELR